MADMSQGFCNVFPKVGHKLLPGEIIAQLRKRDK
jgi:hypothetical protein